MSQRVTQRDIDDAFTRLTNAIRAAGVEPTGLFLQHGNQGAGRAWRIFWSNDKGGLRDVFYGLDRGYLGWNMRETYEALHMLTQGIYFGLGERPS